MKLLKWIIGKIFLLFTGFILGIIASVVGLAFYAVDEYDAESLADIDYRMRGKPYSEYAGSKDKTVKMGFEFKKTA